MSTRIDIRRTVGGLRLLVPACGAPRRSIRLSYTQADDLITAIRARQFHILGDTPRPRSTGEPAQPSWTALLDACGWLHLRDHDIAALGDALSAHMPDRMTPLPAPRTPAGHPADNTRN